MHKGRLRADDVHLPLTLQMEGANPSSLIPLLLRALWWNSFYPAHVTGNEDWYESSDPLLAGRSFLLPLHVGAVHLNIDVSVTSSLQGCQRSQLDSLWVVQRHGKEWRQFFSTTLRGVQDAENSVCLGCLWRNWKEEGSTWVVWPTPGVPKLLLATSKGGTNPKSSCLSHQWRYKFMGKATFSRSSYF